METKHVTQKVKSGLVLTLIFSYLDTFERVQIVLRQVSKRGQSFLNENFEQLRYFCVEIPLKPLKFSFSSEKFHYNIPQSKIVDQLTISLSSDGNFDYLKYFAEQSLGFNQIVLTGEVTHQSLFDNDLEKDKLGVLAFLGILMKKTRKLDLSQLTGSFFLTEYINFHLNEFSNLENIALDINQNTIQKVEEMHILPFLTSFTVKLPQEMLIDGNGNTLVRYFSSFPDSQVEDLKLVSSLESIADISRFSTRVLMNGQTSFKNLRSLKLCLDSGDLQTHFELLAQFKHIEEFGCYSFPFEFNLLKCWKKLRILEAFIDVTLFSEEYIPYIQKLKTLNYLLFSHKAKDPKHRLFGEALENSESLNILVAAESLAFDGASFVRNTKNCMALNYLTRFNYMEAFFREFEAQSKVFSLTVCTKRQEELNYRKMKRDITLDTTKRLDISLAYDRISSSFKNQSLSKMKSLGKLTLRQMTFDTVDATKELLSELLLSEDSKLEHLTLVHIYYNPKVFEYFLGVLNDPRCKLKTLVVERAKSKKADLNLLQEPAFISSIKSLEKFKVKEFCLSGKEALRKVLEQVKNNQNLKYLQIQAKLPVLLLTQDKDFKSVQDLILATCSHLLQLKIDLSSITEVVNDDLKVREARLKKRLLEELLAKMPLATQISIR